MLTTQLNGTTAKMFTASGKTPKDKSSWVVTDYIVQPNWAESSGIVIGALGTSIK